MRHNNHTIRELAREKTRGNVTLISACYLFIFIIFFAINYPFITNYYNNPTLKNDLLSLLVTILSQCLFSVGSCGILLISLNAMRNKSVSIKDMLFPFKKHTDRYLISIIIVLLLSQLPLIPYMYMGYAYSLTDIRSNIKLQLIYLLLNLVGTIISFYITVCYSMTSYLLLDDQQLHPIEALKMSNRLMKGHKKRYIFLTISFIGHLLLSILTLFILLPRTLTYVTFARTYFYADLVGEGNVEDNASDNTFNQLI